MLIQKITRDRDLARASQNAFKRDFLSTLIGECTRNKKDPPDIDCIATIRKFIKGVDEIIELTYDDVKTREHTKAARVEKAILESYLPTQLGEPALIGIINNAIDNGHTNLGLVMGYLKDRFSGQYDGAMASSIAKEVLRGRN